MGSLFAKISKWTLIGVGSVLSLVPAIGPVVGGGLIAAGASININGSTGSSLDPVANAATTLQQVYGNAGAATYALQGGSVINGNQIFAWIQQNVVLILGVLGAIILLPKLFNKK